jgi:DNA-binding transcriptional ArsR family regulator
MAARPLPDDLIELIVRRFRVLADLTRIKLLDLLRGREASVQELAAAIGSTQQNVSKHLGVLRQEGIVRRRKLGNYSYYSVADEGVFALCEYVCGDLANQHDSGRELVASARARARQTRGGGSGEPSLLAGRRWQGGERSETS